MDSYAGFREFVAARRLALSRTAYLLTGDHSLAEDLLQTSLVRTAVHWHRIADADPEAYLRRVMVNERTSRWRRRRYGVEIPVLMVDGKKAAKYRISEAELRRVLLARDREGATGR